MDRILILIDTLLRLYTMALQIFAVCLWLQRHHRPLLALQTQQRIRDRLHDVTQLIFAYMCLTFVPKCLYLLTSS